MPSIHNLKKTKMIASIGPSTYSEEKIIALYKAGVNVLRFNFSHADYDNTKAVCDIVHRLNDEMTVKLGLLLDTKGPEIRTGDYEGLKTYAIGDVFNIYVDIAKVSGDKDQFCDYPYLIDDVQIGGLIKIESGLFDVKVLEKKEDHVVVEALHAISIKQRRHINLPGVKLRLPGLIDQDKIDVKFAVDMGMDYIAMSFVRSAANVKECRDFLAEHGAPHIQIISKIENQEALDNLEEIVEASDGVMVARGDLGIEVAIQELPISQRNIVKLCKTKGKMVIVATHMFESMIENPFPTRAEVGDTFNAIVQKADAVMMSGETTIGKYPIQTAEMMKSVIMTAEKVLEYTHAEFENIGFNERDVEKKFLIRSAIESAERNNIECVLVFTKTGKLAKMAAAYRPKCRIYAVTNQKTTFTNTALLFGVISRYMPYEHHSGALDSALRYMIERGDITKSDRVVVVSDQRKHGVEVPMLEIVAVGELLDNA
jgi:pyruvate kinase